MCRTVLGTSENRSQQTFQSLYTMHRRPPTPTGRLPSKRRIACRRIANCTQMSFRSSHDSSRPTMVSQLPCQGSHQMDSSMRQTPTQAYILHGYNQRLRSVMHRRRQSNGLQISAIFRREFRWRPTRQQINNRRILTLSRTKNIRSTFMDLQEQGAVSHSSTEAEIISLEAGSRLEGLPSLILWTEILSVFSPHEKTNTVPSLKNDESRYTEIHNRE